MTIHVQPSMAEMKPKIIVTGGARALIGPLREALGDRYEIIESAEDGTADDGSTGDLVLATPGDVDSLLGGEMSGSLPAMLLDALGEGACLSDAGGTLLWSNDRFNELDASIRSRIGEACRQAHRTYTKDIERGRQISELRRRQVSMSLRRGRRHYEVILSAVRSRTELCVAAIVRDVTSRRRQLEKIEAINRAGQDLLHMDAKLVKEMHVSERLRLLERKVIRITHELLNFDHFAIRLVNPESNSLDLVMAAGLPEEAKEIDLRAEVDGNGISGYVAATGRSYICHDAQQDDRYIFGLDQAGSSLTVPLKLFDKVIGIFNVESNDLAAFSESDRQFAEIFAQYVAMALHILNLLLVERVSTRESATGTVQGEVSEPLNDLVTEAEWLKELAGGNPEAAKHIQRILEDVDSIRRRIQNVARGPQTLLGVDDDARREEPDPLLMGRRILVVDNEPVVRETIRNVLQKRGCKVVECETGAAGIDRLRASATGDESFSLVLSDISLGDRSGYELFAAAKKADRSLPVILMTGFGYDPHHSIVRASQEGLQCVLFKPFQVQRLLEEARRAIEEAEKGPAAQQ